MTDGEQCVVCGDDAVSSVGDVYFCCLEHELDYFNGIPDRDDYE